MCSHFGEQEASYITESERRTPTASVARKDSDSDSPLDVKTQNHSLCWKREKKQALRRAVNPEMTTVTQRIMSVNYLCYIMLCKTSCCINIFVSVDCDELLLLTSLSPLPTKFPLTSSLFPPHTVISNSSDDPEWTLVVAVSHCPPLSLCRHSV